MGKRLMLEGLCNERGAVSIRALCLDPGPKKCGVGVIEYYAKKKPAIKIAWAGVYEWKDVITLASLPPGPMQKFNFIAIEDLVPAHGNQMVASKYLIETAMNIGRVLQCAAQNEVMCERLSRRMVIKRLTGKAPGPKNKVSKADMQETVRKVMGLEKPIRPQHANDAVCVGLALLGHPKLPGLFVAEAADGSQRRQRKTTKRRGKARKA